MTLTSLSFQHRHGVAAVVLLVIFMGLIGFMRTPTDLFPDTFPPQVVILTVWPGAGANDVSDKITEIVEKEVNTLGGIVNIRSTSRDQVSSVSAEFTYAKDPGQAILDVQNAIARIQSNLPSDAQPPRIYRLSDASARPLVTLSLTPQLDTQRTLSQIRLLAENQIQDRLLRLEGIADVEVFGAHQPEVQVRVDRDKLAAHTLSLEEVITAIAARNISAPAGNIYTDRSEYLVRIAGEFANLSQISDLPLRHSGAGLLRLADVATIELVDREARSLYHGNGSKSIALGIIKPDGGNTVAAIEQVKAELLKLRVDYPDIAFDITQDQQPLIDLNMDGMLSSIIQAVLLTVIVIFLFLAQARAALIAGIAIPLSFLFSFIVLWLTPYTLNMITLSGLIVATGMVVDAAVVVLENIDRHFRERKDCTPRQAALEGTQEVALAITAGMLTTVAVLVPIILIGGYPGRTIGRLSLVIAVTMIASLIVALTVVPLLAARLLNDDKTHKNILERVVLPFDRLMDHVRDFYLLLLRHALRWRTVTLLLAAAFFMLTMRNIPPLLGGALMPPMDTGIAVIAFDLPATAERDEVEDALLAVEAMIYKHPGIKRVSSVVGSEPGAISFGAGGATAQAVVCTVELVDRTRRDQSIWQIQEMWREELRRLPGIKSFRVSEYGATPMATTKAPLDVILSGPDSLVLDRLADQCLARLRKIPGITDLQRSWHFDESQVDVHVDPALARLYGTTTADVARQLNAAVQGTPASSMRLHDFLDIPIRVQYAAADRDSIAALENTAIRTAVGMLPLRALAETTVVRQAPFVTREKLQPTIDITAVNHELTIAHVAARAQKALANITLPRGYSLEIAGTAADMKATQAKLRQALIIGLAVLYLLLVSLFHSFIHPITVMAAIPLAIAGSFWGMLVFDKPMCMPANMGMIFLAGIIINNSVLLLDFIIEARKKGMPKDEAILQSVKLRTRPILMTTLSTIIGLAPLIFEMSVGLERLSPLGIVAGSGLLLGTFLTMIVVPVVYSVLDSLSSRLPPA